ncbi:MAG: undecaprenyl/decaprenyl-phosphate alpha-N-acetylglucosaminyl 1-phosphate transferase [Caldilineae bacterium]|nr:MAG: undecaprenyl/decaprenyl-phosphate alpha-N-acetylglucosaminyl 1-phosphate transferase [Caldilineae bacterium]
MALLIFATAFLISFLLTPLLIRLGPRLGMADAPGGRRQHRGVISRLGGVAIFAAFMTAGLLVFALNPPPPGSQDRKLLTGGLVGTGFVFVYGLLDDRLELPAWPQFIAQFGAAMIAIGFTIFIEEVTLPVVGFTRFPWYITYPLTVFWVMGMLNTVNFLDGLDGLATGVAAIAAALFAWHAFSLGQTRVYLFPLALAGACLGFLPFNFSPARIFLGSSGAFTLGWTLASLSILAPAKVATALLVLGIPILDVAWLVIVRWRTKGSPLIAGRDHLHFRLLDRGFSQRTIVLGYYLFCLTFGLLALVIASRLYKLVALLVLATFTLGLLWQLAKTKPD